MATELDVLFDILKEILKTFNLGVEKLLELEKRIMTNEEGLKASNLKLDAVEAFVTTEIAELKVIIEEMRNEQNAGFAPFINRLEALGSGIQGISDAVKTKPDTDAPTVPANLALVENSITSTGANFIWEPSTDNAGIKGYAVHVNGEKITEVTGPSALLSGLVPGTNYAVQVQAIDKSGNLSALSNTVSFDTLLVDGGTPNTSFRSPSRR